MTANVLEVKDRVQRLLVDFVGPVQVDSDGDFTFRMGSARVFIRVVPHGRDAQNTVVSIMSPTNLRVPPSPELFRYVATTGYVFGDLMAIEREDGVYVHLSHNLLGDFLDPDELKWAVGAVASTADDVDDEIHDKFGGSRFHEE